MMWEKLASALHCLRHAAPLYAATAILLYAVSVLLAGARWRIVLAGQGARVRLGDASAIILASIFVNNVTPGSRIGGELCRIALIRRKLSLRLPQATASIAYDRLMDVVPIGLVILLSLPMLGRLVGGAHHPILVRFLLAVFALLAVLWYSSSTGFRSFVERRKEQLRSLELGKLGWRTAIPAVACSLLIWLQDLLRLMAVARAFGVKLDPGQAATLSVVSLVGGSAPTIGGLGAIEGGLTAALRSFGIALELAIAITLLERAISFVLSSCAGGLVIMALGGKKIWSLIRQQSPERVAPVEPPVGPTSP